MPPPNKLDTLDLQLQEIFSKKPKYYGLLNLALKSLGSKYLISMRLKPVSSPLLFFNISISLSSTAIFVPNADFTKMINYSRVSSSNTTYFTSSLFFILNTQARVFVRDI